MTLQHRFWADGPPISGFCKKALGVALAAVLLFTGRTATGQEEPRIPVAEIFKVMELATSSAMNALWPEFKPSEIPVLVFDGLNTYLFHSRTIPDGFAGEEKDPGVLVYKGQHPRVRGNSIIRLGDTWIATSVLSASSRRTGEKYALKDMAGIIVHEQFHIFQRTHHPQWRQDDGVLLRYPDETVEALFLRRLEKEAFKRAVVSGEREEMAAWAKLALEQREERLGRLAPPFVLYEKELQWTEGLSDYIERIARGSAPLNASNITNGIAPAGIRDLGYVEGRWIAMILDKLRPGWKSIVENDDSLYLEDVLKTVLHEWPAERKAFSSDEMQTFKATSRSDFVDWQARKKEEIEKYSAEPGFRIEIDSSANPLAIRIFEPLEMEILDDGGVYHRVIFAAGNDLGSLRIQNRPCLAYFNDSSRVTRLLVNGLKEAPEIIEGERKVIMKSDGVSIELKYSRMSLNKTLFIFEL